MRTFIDGNGNDSTSAVLAYLQSGNQLRLADLYLIGEMEDPAAVFLTNWESPLLWAPWGTFKNSSITRGKITSQVGLKVDTFQFDWSPQLTAFGTTLATANPYQLAMSAFFDNRTFRLWRAVMPTPGDVNTYGACIMFGGRISNTQVQRGKISFTVNSFLDVVNQYVPPNLIELNNTAANFAGNTPVVADSETTVPQFTIAALTPTSVTGINNSFWATCTGPTPGKIYSLNKLRYGYMVFNPGSSLAGYFGTIGSNGGGKINGVGTTYNHFITYQAFPWPPQIGDTFYVSTKPPINLQDAATGFEYFGFPYVPQPESAA